MAVETQQPGEQQADTRTNVYTALLAARAEFGPVVKGKTAKGTKFSYKYVDLDTVLDAVSPALTKYGLLLIQRTEVSGSVIILVTEIVHAATGELIAASYPLVPAQTNDPQALGGCLTYARRYCAMAILGLAAEDEDDDGQAATRPAARSVTPSPRPANGQPVIPVTSQQLDAIANLVREVGWDDRKLAAALRSKFQTERAQELTSEQAATVIAGLEQLKLKQADKPEK